MSTVRKVAVIGWGAIGRVVGTALAEGRVTGAELVRIVDNRPLGEAAPVRQATFEEALEVCDWSSRPPGRASYGSGASVSWPPAPIC